MGGFYKGVGSATKELSYEFIQDESNCPNRRRLRPSRGVLSFYRIIERHVIASVSCTVDKKGLIKVVKEAPRPLNVFEIDKLNNPYYPAFNGLLTCLPAYQESMGISEPIDFIFDDQSEKVNLWKHWELLKAKADPTIRRFLGAKPRFEKDEDFLPLQAGDLLAWWVRRWESEGCYDVPDYKLQFPWERKRKMYDAQIRYGENELRVDLEDILSERGLFLIRQPRDTLLQIDEGRRYEEELSRDRVSHSPRSLLRGFLKHLLRRRAP